MTYRLSEIDQMRFGYKTAKADITDCSQVDALMERSAADQISLLIVRVNSDQLNAVHRLEQHGALLMDALVYYECPMAKAYTDLLPEGYKARVASALDAENVESVAMEAFQGYAGHYHADPKLGKEDCDLVYSSWAKSSCHSDGLDAGVLVVEALQDASRPAAFATLKMNGVDKHEGVLFGVAHSHRGKGLYPALMKLGANWGMERGSKVMRVSTQITNLTVQRAWCRLGFLPAESCYTFHKWFL